MVGDGYLSEDEGMVDEDDLGGEWLLRPWGRCCGLHWNPCMMCARTRYADQLPPFRARVCCCDDRRAAGERSGGGSRRHRGGRQQR